MSKIVIALGGNALGHTAIKQQAAIQAIVPAIVSLLKENHQLVITHGNGPQVGMISQAFRTTENQSELAMPFAECTAMSQGYICFHLQQALTNELKKQQLTTVACTCLTQVLVAADDPAFSAPTKPIGQFYSKEIAAQLTAELGYTMQDDAGRGYRRVVASPRPLDIIEKQSIQTLLRNDQLVIACGGGGIPVSRVQGQLISQEAVIDKDFSSELLAELIDADLLIILTAVENLYLNFGKANQQTLSHVTTGALNNWISQGHFQPGSMLPKVQAAIRFATFKPGNKAVITSITGLMPLFQQGTIIQEGV